FQNRSPLLQDVCFGGVGFPDCRGPPGCQPISKDPLTRTPPPPDRTCDCPLDHLLLRASPIGGSQPSRPPDRPDPVGTAVASASGSLQENGRSWRMVCQYILVTSVDRGEVAHRCGDRRRGRCAGARTAPASCSRCCCQRSFLPSLAPWSCPRGSRS